MSSCLTSLSNKRKSTVPKQTLKMQTTFHMADIIIAIYIVSIRATLRLIMYHIQRAIRVNKRRRRMDIAEPCGQHSH